MKLGGANVAALKVGAANASKAYLGSTLVWEAAGGGDVSLLADYDFTEYDEGADVRNEGWSNPAVATNVPYLVAADAGGVGGRILSSVVNASRSVSWLLMPGISTQNGEILARLRYSAAGTLAIRAGVIARYGSEGDNALVRVRSSDSAVRIEASGGSIAQTATLTGVTIPAKEAWHLVRLNVVGDTARAKVWLDGEAEPDAWQAELTGLHSDYVGAGGWGIWTEHYFGYAEFDYVRMSAGETVPLP